MSISKKVGIYSRAGAHPVAKAFAEGLIATGHAPRHRSHSDYRSGETENFEAVVVFGLRGNGAAIADDYRKLNVPVVVVDFGYIDRVNDEPDELTGHWQVSLDGLNKIPDFPCPPDRFEALAVTIAEIAERDGPIILCLQRIGDANHPFDTAAKLERFIDEQPHDELRAHPLDGEGEPLQAMLARAGQIVTWNSNVGHDALLAGVPVEALGPAPYANVMMEQRAEYFARVAYGQWTADEMRAGLAQRFLFDHLLPGVPPAIPEKPPTPVPALQEPAAAERSTAPPDLVDQAAQPQRRGPRAR